MTSGPQTHVRGVLPSALSRSQCHVTASGKAASRVARLEGQGQGPSALCEDPPSCFSVAEVDAAGASPSPRAVRKDFGGATAHPATEAKRGKELWALGETDPSRVCRKRREPPQAATERSPSSCRHGQHGHPVQADPDEEDGGILNARNRPQRLSRSLRRRRRGVPGVPFPREPAGPTPSGRGSRAGAPSALDF